MPRRSTSASKRRRTAAEIFGANLKAARLDAGLTQVQLSELTGVPQSRISAIEVGHRDIMLSTIIKLSEAIGCSLADLFRE